MVTDRGEQESYQEVMIDIYWDNWLKPMQEEMSSLYKKHTYDLVPVPKKKETLKNKWVYKLKTDNNILQPWYMACLAVKHFSQRKGIDFEEIFFLVVKISSIRVIQSLAASMDLKIEQFDVKTAFLHSDLEEDIFIDRNAVFTSRCKT